MSNPPIRTSHADLTALLGEALPEEDAPRASAGRKTTGGRRRKEKKPLSKTDGRRRRGLGRDRQFNTNITQELEDAIEDAIERFDLTKAEFMERASRFYIQALEDGSAE